MKHDLSQNHNLEKIVYVSLSSFQNMVKQYFSSSLTGKNKQKKIFHFCPIVWDTKFSIISPKGLMLDFVKKFKFLNCLLLGNKRTQK